MAMVRANWLLYLVVIISAERGHDRFCAECLENDRKYGSRQTDPAKADDEKLREAFFWALLKGFLVPTVCTVAFLTGRHLKSYL